MGMAENVWCLQEAFGFVDFIIEYLPDHVPGSHWVSAINGCFCGRIMDLPRQPETSEIDRHWNYWKTLLKITLKMSRGEKKTS